MLSLISMKHDDVLACADGHEDTQGLFVHRSVYDEIIERSLSVSSSAWSGSEAGSAMRRVSSVAREKPVFELWGGTGRRTHCGVLGAHTLDDPKIVVCLGAGASVPS